MAQLMPLPLTVSCFSKIQAGFTFLVPAHPGGPGQRAIKRVCVCVCVHVCVQPRPSAVNMTLPAFAAECRAAALLLLSTGACSCMLTSDYSCPRGAQQQTHRCCCRSMGETHGGLTVLQTLLIAENTMCQYITPILSLCL